MRSPVSIDANQSRAIVTEIGERLRPLMRVQRELPSVSAGEASGIRDESVSLSR